MLVGGKGADWLAGGLGADTFRFNLRDSGPKKSKQDTIVDFEDGDLIDLSPIDAKAGKRGNQEFSFIGDDGFAKKAGELKYVGGKLKGDVDGDGRPDFIIKLEGSPTLTGGDFLLKVRLWSVSVNPSFIGTSQENGSARRRTDVHCTSWASRIRSMHGR